MEISITTAQSYRAAELSVLPAVRAKKCPATGRWKTWESRLPTDCEIRAWFSNQPDAMCIIAGSVSGNLEIIDFDNHGELYEKWKLAIPAEIFAKLVIERTPSGGYHVIYRCESEVCGNIKLAQGVRAGKLATLIETRGEGGLFLCAPTDGYMLIQNDFGKVATIAEDDHNQLLMAAWSLNEHTPAIVDCGSLCGTSANFAVRPGDAFNQSGDLRGLLLKHGWTPVGKSNGGELFKRPGKSAGGCSASLKDNIFYVFSSNAAPFEGNKAYSAFHVYSQLEHDGDFTSANTLFEAGYGTPVQLPEVDLSQLQLPPIQANVPISDIILIDEVLEKYQEMNPVVIEGLLREGETMNIVASPKTGKSWIELDLALSVATGNPWLGFPCKKGKVIIIDNELHQSTIANRIRKVLNAKHHTLEDVGKRIGIENQRGKLKDISAIKDELEKYRQFQPKLIIIDALYRSLPRGTDENDNGGITQLYNLIDQYAKELCCAFVLVHHTSKGNQAVKNLTDVGSGAGAQSRACDSHLVLRKHKEKNVIVMDATTRSFASPQSRCLRWEYPLMIPDATLNPEELDGKESTSSNQNRVNYAIDDVIEMVVDFAKRDDPMTKTLFIERFRDMNGISMTKTRTALEEAIRTGALEEVRNLDPKQEKQTKGKQAVKYIRPPQGKKS